MGQGNNSRRNATPDDHKRRAAGRQQNRPDVEEIRNWRGPKTDPTATGGASGRGAGRRGEVGRTGTDADSAGVRKSAGTSRK
jgi:hypothetical protein